MLNVYSISNKKCAVAQYLADNRVHIAVITETHVQEENKENVQLMGYTLVSKCFRQQGETKGGVATYVRWGRDLYQSAVRRITAS